MFDIFQAPFLWASIFSLENEETFFLSMKWSTDGVVANVLVCDIVVSESEPLRKVWTPLSPHQVWVK